MTYDKNQKVQGELSYAIIDEVDSVLIDEARTPLIISGSAKETGNLYLKVNKTTTDLVKKNKDNELYVIDEKQKSVSLTESGHSEIENILVLNNLITSKESLYEPKNMRNSTKRCGRSMVVERPNAGGGKRTRWHGV